MPSEPSRTGVADRAGAAADAAARRCRCSGLVVADVFQECRGRHEEQVAGHGAAEIQQTVVIAGRPADEHVLQHLLDGPGRARIADEIGAELALRRAPERHVVAEDFYLFAVLDDRRQRVMRRRRLDRIVKLDVGKLGAADDAFLGFGGQRVPAGHIVQIFLHDDIAAAGERWVLRADERGVDRGLTRGFSVPSTKPMRSRSSKYRKPCTSSTGETASPRPHDLRRQFEAEIHALGADME